MFYKLTVILLILQSYKGYTRGSEITGTQSNPVNGSWSDWGQWSSCSATCGTGMKKRHRTCDNPPPSQYGLPCIGDSSEYNLCNEGQCPVAVTHGQWSSWESWGSCSATCSFGLAKRHRACNNPPPSKFGHACSGESTDVTLCNAGPCQGDGVLTDWSSWSTCSASCGTGTTTRLRNCSFPVGIPHGQSCSGPINETSDCNRNLCPVDGAWSEWSNFTTCTKYCNYGQQSRTRTCEYSDPTAPRGKPCRGVDTQTRACNKFLCQVVDGVWTQWSHWGQCSVTCGTGAIVRLRTCSYPLGSLHGRTCNGSAIQTSRCNAFPCPVDGSWSGWSNWTACSATCAGGRQNRRRSCVYVVGVPHGSDCPGLSHENRACNSELCPVDGRWSSWSSWTICTTTCGGGRQHRGRICDFAANAPHGRPCSGEHLENRDCQTELCPVDGKWSTWSSWSQCVGQCGNGTTSRHRKCFFLQGPPHGRDCFGQNKDSSICNPPGCTGSLRAVWSGWSMWSSCSATCGTGSITRSRRCLRDPFSSHSDSCAGSAIQHHQCQNIACPVDGTWAKWSLWSRCSKSCGNGTHHRERVCKYSRTPHGKVCEGNSRDVSTCFAGRCPVDGIWSTWSGWSQCIGTCGHGTKTRGRTCQFVRGIAHGQDCVGQSTETSVCNTANCTRRMCLNCGDESTGIPCTARQAYSNETMSLCPSDKDFCMTDFYQDSVGNIDIYKSCVDEKTCKDRWLRQSSDMESCQRQLANKQISGAYSCHYCCTTDLCNSRIYPELQTLYNLSTVADSLQ